MELKNNILSDKNTHYINSNYAGEELTGGEPQLIIIHSASKRNFHHQADSNKGPSVHIKVDRDGLVTQLIPFNYQGRHTGNGYWEGDGNLDRKSIAIELENEGRLIVAGDRFVSANGDFFEKDEVFTGIHSNEEKLSYWQKYTERQINKAEQLCRLLLMSYQVKYILGHEEIGPGLNVDPGPAFPLNKIRSSILSEMADRPSMEPAFSFSSNNNDISYSRLLSETFLKDSENNGRIVNIKPRSGGWYKLNIDLGGYIKEEWVKV